MGFFKKKKNILPPAEDHIEANLANSTVYVRDLQKIYPSAKGDVQAMKDVNITSTYTTISDLNSNFAFSRCN